MAITNQVDSTIISAFSLAASGATPSIDTLYYGSLTLECQCTGVTGTANGTLQAQASNSGSAWSNIGSAVTINATGSSNYFIDPEVSGATGTGQATWRYYRLNYTAGSITGGSLTVYPCVKSARTT